MASAPCPVLPVVGLPDPEVMAHELGHNLSLRHTPCGIAFDADPSYPYPDGEIGVWGFDARADTLIPPSVLDVMGSGCDPVWISDYHFRKALEYRDAAADTQAQTTQAAREPRLLLSGGVTADGGLQLDPAFVLEAPARLPTRDGPYRVDGFDADGQSLFSLNFAIEEVDHGAGGNFLFAIPFQDQWREALQRVVLSGPEGMTTVDRGSNNPMTILMDRATGRIRGIYRGEDATRAAAAAGSVVGAGSRQRGACRAPRCRGDRQLRPSRHGAELNAGFRVSGEVPVTNDGEDPIRRASRHESHHSASWVTLTGLPGQRHVGC